MRFLSLVLFALLVHPALLKAQEQGLITGNFNGVTLSQMLREAGRQSGTSIFFDPAQTDTLSVTVQADHEKLAHLLRRTFDGTAFQMAVAGSRVFITVGKTITTSLPANFFDSAGAGRTSEMLNEVADTSSRQQVNRASIENRIFEIGRRSDRAGAVKVTLVGYVRDARSGEPIIGASVSVTGTGTILSTDQFGYYSLTLSRGRYILRISNAGMKDTRRQIDLLGNGSLNVELEEYIASLKTVIVTAEKTSNTRNVQMGVNRLNIQNIRQVPVVFGETDVVKVVLTLPGVTSVGEAANGFNVRGGSADQNLILFNDATVYNPSHLFGFFSAFDPDVVKGIELYKSAIPEKYGGRLSSVLDVSAKDGNSKKWTGSGGIGLLTSKFTIEGPIKKDRTTLVAGVRTTYSDWLLDRIPKSTFSNSTANFYDATLRLTHIIDSRNTIYLTGYLSQDRFRFNQDTLYEYANRNANFKWKHNFSNVTTGTLTAGIDHYQYSVTSTTIPVNSFKLGFDITQIYGRLDFNWNPGPKHQISYGLSVIHYKINPGTQTPVGQSSLIAENRVDAEQGLESALYLGDQYAVTDKLSVSAGLRYSLFNYLGPQEVYQYVPGLPRQTATQKDSLHFGDGKLIKTYSAPEIRLSARYSLSGNSSLKASFNTMQQYIHSISNTTSLSPTDIWKLSDSYIKPQQGAQVSLGFYQNFNQSSIEASVEVFYKRMRNFLDYKSGANLVLNHHLETDVISTRGKAYGIEFLLRKNAGKINGWISYTYSRTFLQQNDPLAGETINGGKYYPASFDKPHILNFISNYRFSHRYSASLNVVYSTGRPITLPLAIYTTGGSPGLYYSDRNAYRISDYFRTDISFTMEGNAKATKKTHNSWSAGIYNFTGRENAYSVYFVQQNGKVRGYQLSIFGTLIPFVTYNIKF